MDGGAHQLPANKMLTFPSFSLLVYLSLIIYPPPFYHSLIGGKGLCGPFNLSHSEGLPWWIVGNRIQLCCRRRVCVSACAGMRVLARVRAPLGRPRVHVQPVLCQFDGSAALLSPI